MVKQADAATPADYVHKDTGFAVTVGYVVGRRWRQNFKERERERERERECVCVCVSE